jgi:dihydroorotate dehydrogenase subfamily 1
MSPDLKVEYCGVQFKNPLIVASATPTKNAEYMRKCAEAGAGGLISKTISPEKLAQQYSAPRFTVLHKSGWPKIYSNYSCEALSTIDVDDWFPEMVAAKKSCDEYNCTLVGSISGVSIPNWQELAKKMEDVGVPMIELNFGCPHPKDLGYKSGQVLGNSPDAAAEVVSAVVDSIRIPVFTKLTGEAVNIVEAAGKMKEAGAKGVTIINRYSSLDIDLPSGRPILHSAFAGIGGPWMRPIMLKWVAKIAQAHNIPISATNGIYTWRDFVKALMVGATTVQLCTAIIYGGKKFGIIDEILKGLTGFLIENGYSSVKDVIGLTLPQIVSWDKVDRESKPSSKVIDDLCDGCAICPNWCFKDAITMTGHEENAKAVIDTSKCEGCGLCPSLCPRNAIEIKGDAPVYLGDFS